MLPSVGRRQPAQRRIEVQVGREGIALGAGGQGAVGVVLGQRALRPQREQRRVEVARHPVAVYGFHRPPEGRRDLQQRSRSRSMICSSM
jgi:hypothetical protein